LFFSKVVARSPPKVHSIEKKMNGSIVLTEIGVEYCLLVGTTAIIYKLSVVSLKYFWRHTGNN
jgi:hypothetical protein